MQVLVTGGAGFLGLYIVEQLVARGDRVRVFCRRPSPRLDELGVEWMPGDVRDAAAVERACAGRDVVFHAAAVPGVWGPWKTFYEVNTLGTRHVIDACLRQGVPKLVYTSSPSVVYDGADHHNADESLPYPERYLCHYPHTKALAEQAVLEANGLKTGDRHPPAPEFRTVFESRVSESRVSESSREPVPFFQHGDPQLSSPPLDKGGSGGVSERPDDAVRATQPPPAPPYQGGEVLRQQGGDVLRRREGEGLFTVALRPHLIWGPRDNHLVPRLIRRAKSGRLRRVGDGRNLISMVYVENAAAAHLQAADALGPGSPAAGRAYFINEPQPVPLWEWVNELLARAGLPPVTRSISKRAAWRIGAVLEAAYCVLRLPGEPPMTRFLASQLSGSHHYDISQAQRDFGYTPLVTVDEGLRRLEPELRRLAAGG